MTPPKPAAVPPAAAKAAPPTPAAGAAPPDGQLPPVAAAGGFPGVPAFAARKEHAGTPGPRTFTLELPPGLRLLNLNDRSHWAARYRREQSLMKATWAMALQAKLPRLEKARIVLEYQPPDRRDRDEDNLAATAKPCIDGLKHAGVFADDNSSHVRFGGCEIGPMFPRGRIVIHIIEEVMQ